MNSYEKAIWCINNRKDLWKPEQMLELFNKILDHPEWFAQGFCSRKNLIKIVGTKWLIWFATGNTLRDIKILEVNNDRSYSPNDLYYECIEDRGTLVIEVPKGSIMEGEFLYSDISYMEVSNDLQ